MRVSRRASSSIEGLMHKPELRLSESSSALLSPDTVKR
jgi:hypothetical protein